RGDGCRRCLGRLRIRGAREATGVLAPVGRAWGRIHEPAVADCGRRGRMTMRPNDMRMAIVSVLAALSPACAEPAGSPGATVAAAEAPGGADGRGGGLL